MFPVGEVHVRIYLRAAANIIIVRDAETGPLVREKRKKILQAVEGSG